MPNSKTKLLIIGAGPVGLALAVELVRRGFRPRIIDKNSGPTPPHESRALGFNLRSLDLLSASGVSAEIIAQGFEIKLAQFHWQGKRLVALNISDHARPDARMTTIPQGGSERIMLDNLAGQNIAPEWGTQLIEVKNFDTTPCAKLKTASGKTETHQCQIIVGCDGAHSVVRKQAGIEFSGEATPALWGLLDAQYDRDLVPHQVNAFLEPGSARAHIPVNANTLRIISNSTDLDDDIPYREHLKEITWRSEFGISYRMVERFSKGNIHLCGDAAHIHSPAGGRGMNLGIEDACWLAWCIDKNTLHQYSPARLKAAKLVLAETKTQTNAITSSNKLMSWLIKNVAPIAMRNKTIRQKLLTSMLGLDTAPPPWL